MQSVLIVFYLLLILWLLVTLPFFKNAGLSKWMLIALFLVKIAAGIVYAKYYELPQNNGHADTWAFYSASLTETDWLLRDPAGFVQDYFHSPYKNGSNLFSGSSSYWNDLDYNTFVKGLAVLNVITYRNYYINLLILNFFFFFGPVALYRLAQRHWKYNSLIVMIPVFLLPSFLFWCSGLHKDGLIFASISVSIFSLHSMVHKHQSYFKNGLVILFCLLLLFALRNVLLLLLLPALAAYVLSENNPRFRWYYFTGIYLTAIVLFFLLPVLFPALNFPQYIVSKQAEFQMLNGNSKIELPALQPSFLSFVHFFPYAVDLIFFRPYAGELKNISYVMCFVENTGIIILIIASVLFQKKNKKITPLLLLFLFFSVSVLLTCGYTVPFIGAIVRYKSIVLPFLTVFLLLSISNKLLYFLRLVKE